MIQDNLKKLMGKKNTSWAKWAAIFGKERSNFRRQVLSHFTKLNKWLSPLGYEIWIKRKKK